MSVQEQARRNLVVVRAGELTLHRDWLKGSKTVRNWDLVVSWYGKTAYVPVEDETTVQIEGGKWDGLSKTFAQAPDLLDRYDYVWLPDDDIATTCEAINSLFNLMRAENLLVGQPALSWNSYITYIQTYRVPGLRLRYVDMVEVMVPCFNMAHLKHCLPMIGSTMTGWGLDWIWCRNTSDNYRIAAVFDEVVVSHTRPVGKFLLSLAKEKGEQPIKEFDELVSRYGLIRKKLRMLSYEARTVWFDIKLGPFATQIFIAVTYLLAFPFLRDRSRARKKFLKLFRLRKPDLRTLSLIDT
jgi:hypothetical protein